MNRDENQEAMTANEWRVRTPHRHYAPMHNAPPSFFEMYAGPLLCIASALVVGMVVGFCLGYGYAGGVR